MTDPSSGTRVSEPARAASSSRPSAAVTLASPTGCAGPEGSDGTDARGGSDTVGAGAGGGGTGEDVAGAGADHDGAGAVFAGTAAGESAGAGGRLHAAAVRIASPHPAAAAIVPCLIEIRPRADGTVCRGSLPCRRARQHGGGTAQPKLGISPTVVDMSITAKAAPCGSVTAANRPNGLSIGPKCSFPPCFWVFDTASSQSGTPK